MLIGHSEAVADRVHAMERTGESCHLDLRRLMLAWRMMHSALHNHDLCTSGPQIRHPRVPL
jgi:hypothetical protein